MSIGFIACIYILIAFYTDIRWMIIPNRLVVAGTGAGMLIQVLMHQWSGFITSIVGFCAVFVACFGLYWIKAFGAGDVKGLAALAAITGTQFTLNVLAIAIIYAGIVWLLIIVYRGSVGQMVRQWLFSMLCYWSTKDMEHLRLAATHRVHTFPFMVAVMPAFATCLFMI